MSDRTPSENRNARRVESLPRDFAVEARNWLWRHVSNDNVQIEQFIFPLSSLMSDVHNRAQQMGQGSALKETSGHQSTTSDVARAQPGAPDGVDGPGNLSKEKPADPRQPCPTCKLPRLMPRPEVPPFSQRQAPHVIAEARRRAGLPPFSVTDEVFGLALLDILTERGSGGHINGPLVPAPVQDTTEKPLPGAELAEKHGFKPHGKDPLTGHVLPPSDGQSGASSEVGSNHDRENDSGVLPNVRPGSERHDATHDAGALHRSTGGKDVEARRGDLGATAHGRGDAGIDRGIDPTDAASNGQGGQVKLVRWICDECGERVLEEPRHQQARLFMYTNGYGMLDGEHKYKANICSAPCGLALLRKWMTELEEMAAGDSRTGPARFRTAAPKDET
jgi:hypothetical protein